ncbi:MAG: HEAT repeat domain-containing protein [Deltaproteobacteria bacterium]|nr:HEAT repeat domain-containing protein [Deltaproteobacteria bacterium]
MNTTIYTFSAALVALVLAAGCAPSITHLEKHLDADRYADAVAEVTGDEQMEAELAALVIERATTDPEASADALVNALASSGAPGKRALERIADSAAEPLESLARVALRRGSPPRSAAERATFLKHSSSDVRAAAATAWSRKLGRGRLQELLLDHDPRVRRAAVTGLAKHMPDKEVSSWLREALRLDPDPKVRAAAARLGSALGGKGKGLDALRDALADENMGVRLAALRGLGAIGKGEAVELLKDATAGPMTESVVVAAAELARIGDKDGRARFDEALSAGNPTIRSTALTHLGRAGIDDRQKLLVKALDDESPQVVLLAASMLLGSDHAGPDGKVAGSLERVAELEVARSAEARDMLAVLGNADAVAEVTSLLAAGDGQALVTVLVRVRRAGSLRARFVELLAHEEQAVRVAAARAVLVTSLG